MASPAQVAANRQNALHSSGPRSVAGKAVSRFNALKSGVDAKSMIIPGEDQAELDALKENYQLQFQPTTPAEQFLVDEMTRSDWLLRRYHRFEAILFDEEISLGQLPPGDRLTRVHRRIDAAQRAYFRSLKELQRQIENRPEIAEPEPEPEPIAGLGSFRQVNSVVAPSNAVVTPAVLPPVSSAPESRPPAAAPQPPPEREAL